MIHRVSCAPPFRLRLNTNPLHCTCQPSEGTLAGDWYTLLVGVAASFDKSVTDLFSSILECVKERLTPPLATEIYAISKVSQNVNGLHYLVFLMTNE